MNYDPVYKEIASELEHQAAALFALGDSEILNAEIQAIAKDHTEAVKHQGKPAIRKLAAGLSAAFDGDFPGHLWATPIGTLYASTAPIRGDVTHAEAAEMLGVARGTVAVLASREDLVVKDGKIQAKSVTDRIVRLAKERGEFPGEDA